MYAGLLKKSKFRTAGLQKFTGSSCSAIRYFSLPCKQWLSNASLNTKTTAQHWYTL